MAANEFDGKADDGAEEDDAADDVKDEAPAQRDVVIGLYVGAKHPGAHKGEDNCEKRQEHASVNKCCRNSLAWRRLGYQTLPFEHKTTNTKLKQ